jgi:hypothetical protein
METRTRPLCDRIIEKKGRSKIVDASIGDMARLICALEGLRIGGATYEEAVEAISAVLFDANLLAAIFGEKEVEKAFSRRVEKMENIIYCCHDNAK